MAALTPNHLPEDAGSFDTMTLLQAVDELDHIRDTIGGPGEGGPSGLRDDLMILHGLVYGLLREGGTPPDASLVWQLLARLETAVAAIIAHGERLAHILHTLRESLPEPDAGREEVPKV